MHPRATPTCTPVLSPTQGSCPLLTRDATLVARVSLVEPVSSFTAAALLPSGLPSPALSAFCTHTPPQSKIQSQPLRQHGQDDGFSFEMSELGWRSMTMGCVCRLHSMRGARQVSYYAGHSTRGTPMAHGTHTHTHTHTPARVHTLLRRIS